MCVAKIFLTPGLRSSRSSGLELTPQTLTHWIRLLLDDAEGCVQAAFLYRIVEASVGAVSAATLETVQALLASSESQICRLMLEAIEQALPMGFLGLDELHAGIAGLRWAVGGGGCWCKGGGGGYCEDTCAGGYCEENGGGCCAACGGGYEVGGGRCSDL